MKNHIGYLHFLLYLACSPLCFSRPVTIPTLDELWAAADVVAVIRPLASTNAPDQLTSAGPKYRPRDPKDYQAMNTRCEVVLTIKMIDGLKGWQTNQQTLI